MNKAPKAIETTHQARGQKPFGCNQVLLTKPQAKREIRVQTNNVPNTHTWRRTGKRSAGGLW
jgi:hypothetical protein